MKEVIKTSLSSLEAMSTEARMQARYDRFRNLGQFVES